MDLAHRTIQRGRNTVSVSAKTFDLLAYLVLHPQRVVTKQDLLDFLWPDSGAEESALSQQVLLLRKALTGTQSGDKFIVPVPDRGYRFTPAVTLVTDSRTHSSSRASNRLDLRDSHAEPHSESSVSVAEPEEASAPEPPSTAQPPDPGPEQPAVSDPTPEPPVASDADPESGDDSESEPPRRSGLFAALANSGPLLIVAVMAAIALLASAGWYGWRWYQLQHPAASSLGLVVGKITNSTGDPEFDDVLQSAATIDLRQSPFLRIAGDSEVLNALNSIQSPAGKVLIREVCRRLGDQAYLNGDVRRLGQKYLLSLVATDCNRGDTLARSVGIADSPQGVLLILDRVAADLRLQLGENPTTVAGFSKPLFGARVPSLEALKDYAQATALRQQGKSVDSIPVLNRAIELDPGFTLAYADLGVAYSLLGDQEMTRSTLSRAYDERDTVGDYDRFAIVAAYDSLVKGDLQDSIRNQKEGMLRYPQNADFPANLAQLYLQIGNPVLALDAAQRALGVNPASPAAYVSLARAYLELGRLEEAAATCRKAIEKHVDNAEIHGFLLQMAYMRLDQPAIDEQVVWGENNDRDPSAAPYMHLQQGLMAFEDGKAAAASLLFARAAGEYGSRGQLDVADQVLSILPRAEAELGLLESALAQLTRQPSASETVQFGDSADIPVAWAEVGETSRAEALLKRALDSHPTGTLWQQDLGAQIRAAIDLNQHLPAAAVDALAPAAPYEMRSFDVPALRGRAYLAANQPELAEREFHKILDHQGVEPLSYNYPLARLGLARALAAEGKTVEAGFAYGVLFEMWKDADPTLPRLKSARDEYARLTGHAFRPNASATTASTPARSTLKPAATRR